MNRRREPSRKLNVATARAIPLVLLGLIAYVSWVLTKLLCIDYLINPSPSVPTPRRPGVAAAILTVYYVSVLATVICYGRLLYVVALSPGLVSRGRQYHVEKKKRTGGRTDLHSASTPANDEDKSEDKASGENPVSPSDTLAHPDDLAVDELSERAKDFWQRDVFVCNYDGRPAFCSVCFTWKPDRAHHCSELNRCVLKMDHFCPWVGGVVGEASFKFFIQFNFFGAIFCLTLLISLAYYIAQRKQLENMINVNWAVALALAAMFFLFSAGICASSVHFALVNSTTIENLNKKRKVWCLAVYIPEDVLEKVQQRGRANLRLITYPRPRAEHHHVISKNIGNDLAATSESQEQSLEQPKSFRTFAILETPAGANPWDLGFLKNFKDIMGESMFEWFLPLRHSPCANHDDLTSFYKLGPLVERMKKEAKIDATEAESSHRRRSSSRRRRRHRSRRRHSYVPRPSEG